MKRLRLLALLTLLGCSEDATSLGLAGPAVTAEAAGGNEQAGGVGETLPNPLVVRVTDAEGTPVPGYPIEWTTERGALVRINDSTDNEGLSRMGLVLPPTPGVFTVRAVAEGMGTVTFTVTAQPIGGTITFRFVDAGGYHACGITTTEQLLCWGYGADGQLGAGSTAPQAYPTVIPGHQRYRMVTGGYYHSCGFTLATNAYCWGQANEGRLGNGRGIGEAPDPSRVLTFATIDTVAGDTIVGNGQFHLQAQVLQAGWAHSCAVDLVQRLWCWGRGKEGQNGAGDDVLNAVQVSTAESYKWVTVGGHHSCGITLAGNGRCWGWNAFGQLGNGNNATTSVPQPIPGLDFRIDPLVIFRSPDPSFPLPPGPFMAGGYDHSCGITTANTAVCWGLNQHGQLGDNSRANRNTPGTVLGGHTFVAITAGLRHTCALDSNGAAWCWGANDLGQLGNGSTGGGDVLAPIAVAGGIQFAYIKSGELFTCGVTSDGVAYCWGDNEYGQLGDGTTTSSNVPVKVAFQP